MHLFRTVSFVLVTSAGAACTTSEPVVEWGGESVPIPIGFAPGVVSTDLREYGITFDPTGTEVYFTRRGRRGRPAIFSTSFVEGSWTAPEPVPFSGDGDETPYMSPDGQTLLFASRRPLPGSGDDSENLWQVERQDGRWGEPAPLSGPVNQPLMESPGRGGFDAGAETGPMLVDEQTLLYSGRVESDWGTDLYVAERNEAGEWVNSRPLRINSYGDESNPALSPDGRFLVFQGYRDADGIGDQDLYASARTEYGWSTPAVLPEPVNSPRSDGYPAFSPDGRYFFFASDRDDDGGYYDIFYVDVGALGLTAGAGSGPSPP